jgi:hypothetical protein
MYRGNIWCSPEIMGRPRIAVSHSSRTKAARMSPNSNACLMDARSCCAVDVGILASSAWRLAKSLRLSDDIEREIAQSPIYYKANKLRPMARSMHYVGVG